MTGRFASLRFQLRALDMKFQEIFERRQRQIDPVGPIVQLVAQFVNCLVQEAHAEDVRKVVVVAGQESGVAGRAAIGAQVRRACPCVPGSGPVVDACGVRPPLISRPCRCRAGGNSARDPPGRAPWREVTNRFETWPSLFETGWTIRMQPVLGAGDVTV